MAGGGSSSGKGGVVGPATGKSVAAPAGGGKGGAGAVAGPAAGSAYGVNPMDNAARGFSDAFNLLRQGATQANAPVGSIRSPMTSAAGYNAQGMQGQGYTAAMQQSPEQIRQLMGQYQNPYENQVVNRTANQMQRSIQQSQMGNADAAIASGAFGGGRHGVVEGVTAAEGARNIGDMTAQLRQQGFDTAAGLAGQDIANRMNVRGLNQAALNSQRQYGADAINNARQFNASAINAARQFNAGNMQDTRQFNAGMNFNTQQQNIANQMANRNSNMNNIMGLADRFGSLAGQSYGVGRNINSDQMQAGNMSQLLNQSVLDQAMAGYQQLTNQPANLLQMRLASLGMNPLNNATTTNTQTNPGWGALFGNLIGAAGNMFQGRFGG